ncbi:MAG: hypothetical protein K2Y37_16260 [Pirellulales bacterium]|nr:hypothetical protein [Pirellulales bacterium]
MSSKPSKESQTVAASAVAQAFRTLTQAAKQTLRRIAEGDDQDVDYGLLSDLVEALPLTTAEHGLMIRRLANAQMYSAQGEKGAALYEVTMVARVAARAMKSW